MGHSHSCCVSNRRLKLSSSCTSGSCRRKPASCSASDPSPPALMGRTTSTLAPPNTEDGASSIIPTPGVPSSERRGVKSNSNRGTSTVSPPPRSDTARRSQDAPGGTSALPPPLPDHLKRAQRARAPSPDGAPDPRVVEMFERYRDPDEPDLILACGVESLCRDLSLEPDELRVLLLAWQLGADTMCVFTRAQFCAGCAALRVSSLQEMGARLTQLEADLRAEGGAGRGGGRVEELRKSGEVTRRSDALRSSAVEDAVKPKSTDALPSSPSHDPHDLAGGENFRSLYRWAFGFALDKETNQRILPADLAAALWRLVWSARTPPAVPPHPPALPPLVDQWLAFLAAHPDVRWVSRDTWDTLPTFVARVGDDLGGYNEDDAWPSLFDDFVEYENDRRNQNLVLDRVGGRKEGEGGVGEEGGGLLN